MSPETEDILRSAERNIEAAVRLLCFACGDETGLALGQQLLEDYFHLHAQNRDATPFLPFTTH